MKLRGVLFVAISRRCVDSCERTNSWRPRSDVGAGAEYTRFQRGPSPNTSRLASFSQQFPLLTREEMTTMTIATKKMSPTTVVISVLLLPFFTTFYKNSQVTQLIKVIHRGGLGVVFYVVYNVNQVGKGGKTVYK